MMQNSPREDIIIISRDLLLLLRVTVWLVRGQNGEGVTVSVTAGAEAVAVSNYDSKERNGKLEHSRNQER